MASVELDAICPVSNETVSLSATVTDLNSGLSVSVG